MTMKTCTKCNETKALTEFGKNKNHKDGLQYECTACKTKYNLAYKSATREANRTYFKTLWANMTVVEKKAHSCTSDARGRSDLSSADLYGGLTFTEACAMTEVFVKERLRLEAETGVAHHIDHIIPIAAGGTHTADNLQALTAEENIAKGANE